MSRPPRLTLTVQTPSEAVAERMTQSVLVLGRVTELMRHLVGNLTMMDYCVTDQARSSLANRVLQLVGAICLLLARLNGELGATPFHLASLHMRDVHLRLIDVALRRVQVSPSWESVYETQRLLEQAYPNGAAS